MTYLHSFSRTILTIILTLSASLALAQSNSEHRLGILLVQGKSITSQSMMSKVLAKYKLKEKLEGGKLRQINLYKIRVPERLMDRFQRILKANPRLKNVEKDQKLPPDFTPNDVKLSSAWHLNKSTTGLKAWNYTKGKGIIIAILDTGVESSHPDLSLNMVAGWNTFENNSITADVYGHGTMVAGAAAERGNNTIGSVGPAYESKIMPIRISDPDGFGYASTVADGLIWAADHGARVANVSYMYTNSAVVTDAAKYFRSKGGVVIMSAGNDARYDATADNPEVITVSATDINDRLAVFSNRGNNIDLAAPGVNIPTTVRGGKYELKSGTSISAPVVSGAAALILSIFPNATSIQVEDILKSSAKDLGTAGFDTSFGYGRINFADAVLAAKAMAAIPTATPTAQVTVVNTDTPTPTPTATETAIETSTPTMTPTTIATISIAPTSTPMPTPVVEDITPPTVRIAKLLTKKATAEAIKINVITTDDTYVVKVTLNVDGKAMLKSKASSPTFKLKTQRLMKGNHKLTATACDSAGNCSISKAVKITK